MNKTNISELSSPSFKLGICSPHQWRQASYSLLFLDQKPFFLVGSLPKTGVGGREPVEKCLLKNGRLNVSMLELVTSLGSLLTFFWCLELRSRSLSAIFFDALFITFSSVFPNSFSVIVSPWVHKGQEGSYFSLSAVILSTLSAVKLQ